VFEVKVPKTYSIPVAEHAIDMLVDMPEILSVLAAYECQPIFPVEFT
jgi:hypothetical protein